MKITRRQLQRLILQEVRRLNEGAMLGPEASAHASTYGSIDYESLGLDDNGYASAITLTLGDKARGMGPIFDGMEYTTLAPSQQRLNHPLLKHMDARAMVTDIPRTLRDGTPNPDWTEGSGAA